MAFTITGIALGACGDDQNRQSDTPTDTGAGDTLAPTANDRPTCRGPFEEDFETPPAAREAYAIAEDDLDSFIAQFRGANLPACTCGYNEVRLLVYCGEHGTYEVDRPPSSDMLCAVALQNGEPVFINCETERYGDTDAPLERIFYEMPRE